MDTSKIDKFIEQLKTKSLFLEQYSVYTPNYTSDTVLTDKGFVKDNSITIEERELSIENYLNASFNSFSDLEKFNKYLYSLFSLAVNELLEIYKSDNFNFNTFIENTQHKLTDTFGSFDAIPGKKINYQLDVEDFTLKKTRAASFNTYPYLSLQRRFAQKFYTIVDSLKEESISNHFAPLHSSPIHGGLFFSDEISTKNIIILYDELIKENNIDAKITLEHFTKALNKDTPVYEKIRWTGTITYLVELFTALIANEIITSHINKDRYDKIEAIVKTFCKPNNLDFESSDLYKSYNQSSQKKIKTLISQLKN